MVKNYTPSNRQLRVGELVRRTLAEILFRNEIYDESFENTPITVSEVRCSPDLKYASVYVVPLGGKNSQQLVSNLTKKKGEIRKILGQKLNLKFVPNLRFLEDLSFDAVDKTNELLNAPKVTKDLKNQKSN